MTHIVKQRRKPNPLTVLIGDSIGVQLLESIADSPGNVHHTD
jgi:hypothetical protein